MHDKSWGQTALRWRRTERSMERDTWSTPAPPVISQPLWRGLGTSQIKSCIYRAPFRQANAIQSAFYIINTDRLHHKSDIIDISWLYHGPVNTRFWLAGEVCIIFRYIHGHDASSLITGLKMNALNETLVNLDQTRMGLRLESFPVARSLLRSSIRYCRVVRFVLIRKWPWYKRVSKMHTFICNLLRPYVFYVRATRCAFIEK